VATRRPGRPTKITPAAILTIAERIRACLPLKDAAEAAGVKYRTFAEWRSDGEAEYEQRERQPARDKKWPRLTSANLAKLADMPVGALPGDLNGGERLYLALYEETMRANADAKASMVANIRMAGSRQKVRKVITFDALSEGGQVKTLTRVEEWEEYDWRADAWLLERRWPEDFGKRVTQRSVNLDFNLSELTDEELEVVSEAYESSADAAAALHALAQFRRTRAGPDAGESE
jgi:hypothetical protein